MSKAVTVVHSAVPRLLRQRFLWLPDSARSMGINLVASKGTGKSRLMGRVIAWLDLVRGIPLVVLDPNGPTIDNLLDKIARLPQPSRDWLIERIIYVDMSGTYGTVVPFPLYYRLGEESLYTVAQRHLEAVRKLDPYLQTASIQGWNALYRAGTYTGMLLTAAGLQVTEAEALLRDPERGAQLAERLAQASPELRAAHSFFAAELAAVPLANRSARIDSFLTKIAMFGLDPTLQAMFGASSPGIDWRQVITGGKAVLIDFRHELDLERIRFKMLWVFSTLMEFIKSRGAGRHTPISVVVDELSYLLGLETLGNNPLADDLDELINRISRNYMVWLCLAYQELNQFDAKTKRNLLTMGTQIFGATTDPEAALQIAQRFFRYNPSRVKKREPMYMSDQAGAYVVDYRTVEFSVDEQRELESFKLLDLPRYHFLVGAATAEGTMPTTLQRMSIAALDQGQYVDEERVAALRQQLAERSGRRISEVLTEIAERRHTVLTDSAATPPLLRRRR